MRSTDEVSSLLDHLDRDTADSLEDQDLDFKEWNERSINDAVNLVVDMAVCMANGGGGTVVFGVRDRVVGRKAAVLGVPPSVDANLLRKNVYDRTDPKIIPVFEELMVPEGTGRLLVMQVHPGMPPHTDTSGFAKIRVGKDCQPLTGTMRQRIAVETGETDFTASEVPGDCRDLISAAAMEQLRVTARREKAPDDLLRQSDVDLLQGLGVIRQGNLTMAGLLLAGTEEALGQYLPFHAWTHLRMRSATDYDNRADGSEALPIALSRLGERIMADNPIVTLPYGMHHFEYRTYPEIALREALLNAFCHRDFRLPGPVMVKQSPRQLEISNPGSFIGGVTADNILHHPPTSRNLLLVQALLKLRLVNRSNLGISRMFESLLIEGKEPPSIHDLGDSIRLTFLAREFSPAFRAWVEEESLAGRALDPDHLLIIQFLLNHAEIDTAQAAAICQRPEREARELLGEMTNRRSYLERGGIGRSTYWTLNASLRNLLSGPGSRDRDRRTDWEGAKTRVLSVLRQRARSQEAGLTNSEVRAITLLDRKQVNRLIHELEGEGVRLEGYGRAARYTYVGET